MMCIMYFAYNMHKLMKSRFSLQIYVVVGRNTSMIKGEHFFHDQKMIRAPNYNFFVWLLSDVTIQSHSTSYKGQHINRWNISNVYCSFDWK